MVVDLLRGLQTYHTHTHTQVGMVGDLFVGLHAAALLTPEQLEKVCTTHPTLNTQQLMYTLSENKNHNPTHQHMQVYARMHTHTHTHTLTGAF